MNVLFVPHYSRRNPYQQSLADALACFGVKVHIEIKVGEKIRPFCVYRTAKRIPGCRIVHIHWTKRLLLSEIPWRSVAKSCLFLLELLLLRLSGVKLVRTMHNIADHERYQRRAQLFFNRLLLFLCNAVIVHCRGAWNEVVRTYGQKLMGKVTMVPHGHYIDHYENRIGREFARNLLKIAPEDTVFLYFGAVRHYKGLPQLIKAFRRLRTTRVRLIIAGNPFDNSIRAEIEACSEGDERIRTVLEFIPSEQVQVYMNASDVVVLPFQDTLTSGSVILAMGFAKAIIAPQIGCVPDILNEKGAILYNQHSPGSLFEALEKALQLDLESMGRYSFARVKKVDWKMVGETTYEVYQKCLGCRRVET
ncbi:MAG: glycosyltransferase family 4 protein [Thermodesulfobacteriota bacterium]|nr:glycosyltransferase family 4 protein [Thermodesulfobacteriota bacterium]